MQAVRHGDRIVASKYIMGRHGPGVLVLDAENQTNIWERYLQGVWSIGFWQGFRRKSASSQEYHEDNQEGDL